MHEISRHILRENSIRGVYGQDLDEAVMERIGRGFAEHIKGLPVVVGADHRLSSPALKTALTKGLMAGGCDVSDVGMAPKGLAVFAGHVSDEPVAYVSASHLTREWNGLKFLHPFGRTYNKTECAEIYGILGKDLQPYNRPGSAVSIERKAEYITYLLGRLPAAARPLKILLDHGNGTSALLAPELFERLGFEVTSLYPEVDGNMPNRNSEPTAETLAEARNMVAGHDLGMAFDGDADRVVFIHPDGSLIDPERFAYVMIRRLMKTAPGPIVANVACGQTIDSVAAKYGKKVYRVPVGTPNMVQKVFDTKACFGMEVSSHMVIPSVVPWDDAIAVGAYAAIALAEAVSTGESLASLLAQFPSRPRKRIPLEVPDGIKMKVMAAIEKTCRAQGLKMETMEGIKVLLPEGWVLMRASNTEPAMRVFMEAADEKNLETLENKFLPMIGQLIASLTAKA
ncbi:MAG: hypothetical protein C0404_05555 [Verrucomicrobia bacterium]|nr:hypothetical protein [Verrucomicrobiota bacterium]